MTGRVYAKAAANANAVLAFAAVAVLLMALLVSACACAVSGLKWVVGSTMGGMSRTSSPAMAHSVSDH